MQSKESPSLDSVPGDPGDPGVPGVTGVTGATGATAFFSLDSDTVSDLSFSVDAPLKVCRESRQRRLSRLRPP